MPEVRTALTYLPPSELLKASPCLICLSEHDLLAIIVVALAQASQTYADDTALLLKDSVCYTCLSKKQMLVGFTAMVANQGLNGLTQSEIMEKIKCLQCASPQQLRAAFLYLIAAEFQTSI